MPNDAQEDPDFEQRLHETVVWCSQEPALIATALSPEVGKHLQIMKEVGELIRASQRKNWFWRSVTSNRDRRARSKLISMAAPVVGSLTELFRCSELARQIDRSALRSNEDWENAVAFVARKRHEIIKNEAILPDSIQHTGRILVCNPSETVVDGAAQYQSAGFLDLTDAPPCDTWVHFNAGELVCWIPQQLVWLAQLGIDVNPVDCIRWA